ncbi:hypothetical protein BGX38DRAFT_582409 [Terfezia claveryi]|nr:hypothetical protein BGX38DRAFT_582409 [Terfezia claveryi]
MNSETNLFEKNYHATYTDPTKRDFVLGLDMASLVEHGPLTNSTFMDSVGRVESASSASTDLVQHNPFHSVTIYIVLYLLYWLPGILTHVRAHKLPLPMTPSGSSLAPLSRFTCISVGNLYCAPPKKNPKDIVFLIPVGIFFLFPHLPATRWPRPRPRVQPTSSRNDSRVQCYSKYLLNLHIPFSTCPPKYGWQSFFTVASECLALLLENKNILTFLISYAVYARKESLQPIQLDEGEFHNEGS